MHNAEIKRIYLDNSLLVGWFLPYLQDIKNPQKPKIIEFFEKHKDIEIFISYLTIAELIEYLMFKEPMVRDYKRNKESITAIILL